MKTIKAIPNHNKKTFTLNVEHYNDNDPFNRCLKVRYRTLPFDKEEFNELTYNTERDWINFLSCPWYSQSYYLIKQYQ